jgi:DNA-binding MarR family transcriptional regulator
MPEEKAKKPRRSAAQLLSDRVKLSDMYLAGMGQGEIALALGVSVSTVSREIKTLHVKWVELSNINFDEAKARELAKIDRIEREAWAAWEASKQEGTWKTQSGGEGLIARATITKKSQTGDPQYMRLALDCVDKRCKLLGLVVQKVEHTGKDGEAIKVESKIDGLKELFQAMRLKERQNSIN